MFIRLSICLQMQQNLLWYGSSVGLWVRSRPFWKPWVHPVLKAASIRAQNHTTQHLFFPANTKRASLTKPMLFKWRKKKKVIFISHPVLYTAQIDVPCYVSDQISREPALTSAFGISWCVLPHNSIYELDCCCGLAWDAPFIAWITKWVDKRRIWCSECRN